MSDCFTSLPIELFESIVQTIQEDEDTPPLYVSKAFLPFAREKLFTTITLNSFEDFNSFVRLVQISNPVCKYVQCLAIDLLYEHDKVEPKTKLLKPFFSSLDQVEILEIKHSSRLVKFILNPSTQSVLPSMLVLKLSTTFEGLDNPLDPKHYKNLSRYANLGMLHLDVNRESQKSVGGNASRVAPLHQIKFLELQGQVCRNPAVFSFLSLFPSLNGFSTYDLTTPTSVSFARPILERIPLPEQLVYLRVASLRNYNSPEDISPILRRFSHVKDLDIGMGVFNDKVFDLLNYETFPSLESLTLRYEVSISDEQLKSLITGPKKLHKLKHLDLWLILENEGPPIPEMYSDEEEEEIDEERYYRAIEASGWEEGPIGFKGKLTAKGLEEAVEAADKEGLEVTGYAVEFARVCIESRKRNESGLSDYEEMRY